MGWNFALNRTKGEGVSLKKKYIFFRETHFQSVTTRTQAVVTSTTNASYFSFHLMAKVCVMANLLLNWHICAITSLYLSWVSLLPNFHGGRSDFSLLSGPSLNPVHSHSLISQYAIHYLESIAVSLALCKISKFLASLYIWASWFEPYLVRNPKDRYFHAKVHLLF